MTASVTQLPVSRARKAAPAKPGQRAQSRALRRRLSRQTLALRVVAGVTIALLTVSLTDSARGVELTTGFPAWKGWLLALGIEASYIAAELAKMFAATPSVRRQVSRLATPYGVVTMGMSAALNGLAFSEHADGLAKALPAMVGVLMPVGIFVLSMIGSELWKNGDR